MMKLWYRKGMALHAMQKYDDALQALDERALTHVLRARFSRQAPPNGAGGAAAAAAQLPAAAREGDDARICGGQAARETNGLRAGKCDLPLRGG